MRGNPLKSFAASLLFFLLAAFVITTFSMDRVSAQTNTPQAKSTASAEQQKNLDHLKQLNEQLQKDRDAVDAAVNQHGWDSDEVDAAQQRLFQDRQEYRSLRRSLQSAGVAIPADAVGPCMGPCMGCQNNCSGHCGSHGHGHHGCCGGSNDCSGHHDNGCSGGRDR